jgi:alkaline phosphatase D
MLGRDQGEWFHSEIRASETQWTVWANAVLFTPFTLGLRWLTPGSDSWDGFEAERERILRTFEEVNRPDRTNVVTLTGDMHTTLATYIRSGAGRTPVGVEFMTPGVTSVNFGERVATKLSALTRSRRVGDLGSRHAPGVMQRVMRRLNADYTLLDSAHWGYSVIEFTPAAVTWDVFWVDKTVNAATASVDHCYRVRVPAGEYVIEDLSDESRDRSRTIPSSDDRARTSTPSQDSHLSVEAEP